MSKYEKLDTYQNEINKIKKQHKNYLIKLKANLATGIISKKEYKDYINQIQCSLDSALYILRAQYGML